MAWIESHTVLMRHRKLIGLARALKIRRSYAMGHLHALWHAAIEQQEDGDLSNWTDDIIAEASDYPGDSQEWVKVLQAHGFLDGKFLHDWPDYAHRYVELRYRTSNPEKLAQIREKWDKTDYRQSKDTPPNRTEPNQTKQNQTKPNRQKTAPPTLFGGLEILKFPLLGGGELPIGDGRLPTWKKAYPSVAIEAELAAMLNWLDADQARLKPKSEMPKFITGWLKGQQNQNTSGGKHGNGAAAPQPGKYDGIGEKV